MSDCSLGWKRYLSLPYLANKVQEKGLVWCLRVGVFRLFRGIFRPLYTYLLPVLSYPLYLTGVRFLQITFPEAIGHLAVEPDCYIKEGILGMRPRYFELVLAPRNRVANNHLLAYWRQHLRIISSPLFCRLLMRLAQQGLLALDTGRHSVAINDTAHFTVIQRAWADRRPLLSLSEPDHERGWDCLRKLGVPKDAWFVCVHCREPDYKHSEIHNFRNADIRNYLLAMNAIVERGGWCIRMGDLTMKPLPYMEHVIDYAHLDIKSDWMDIFLCASCTFFLGSNSGLYGVASVFGVPAAVANQAPMSVVLPYGPRDVGIPKLVWSCKEDRYLSFKEVLDSPIGNFRFMHLYTEAGIRVVENSPEDIRDLALEMLEITEGTVTYTAEDERLQERFKLLLRPGHYSYGAISRVGRDFLRKYMWLLPGEELEVSPRDPSERSLF